MFLKFLQKIGRKKVVLDRGPSHPKFMEAKPWMNRYYLIFRNRPKWFPFNILIHEMLADDHGEGVHTHLCPYITIILKGGYWETTKTGKVATTMDKTSSKETTADHVRKILKEVPRATRNVWTVVRLHSPAAAAQMILEI